MKTIIELLDIICILPFLFFSAYLAFLTLLAIFQKMKPASRYQIETRRFAVLVPAHNEEAGIERTLHSLTDVEYDPDRFDVIVIADNCTDKTAEVSRTVGARVFERTDLSLRGKGYALKWCLEKLGKEERPYDAFVIVDADSVVTKNFLKVMNSYLEDGADCIQCSDMVVPQPGAWSPEMTRVAFILHNYVRPLGRKAIGCGPGLNGNGMCFSRKLIEEKSWNSFSRAEDLEHYLQLSLDNVKVAFAPEAVVHATMPTDSGSAKSQRKRWEMGRLPLLKKYSRPLLFSALRRRSFVTLDVLIELVTPAFVNMFAATVLALLVNAIPAALGTRWIVGPAILWGLVVLMELFHVLGGLAAARADRGAYMALANLPRYAFWKIGLYIKTGLRGDDKSWVRTARQPAERSNHS